MYCRTCGNRVHDNAEICVKCGCKPLIGKSFCQNCSSKTLQQQVMCTKCGVRLQTTMTSAQKKKSAENQIIKILGNIILGFGIFCLFATVFNIGDALTSRGKYYIADATADAIRSAIFGIIFVVIGKIVKSKAK